jgi:ribulose-5-phosphate 4-epimerase/fuculose-1-phosphate aldolase
LTIDEGYIKYDSDWTPGPAPTRECTSLLNKWRRPLFDAGLIGHYEDLGVGYGNLSVRLGLSEQFIISGTQTGHIADTGGQHYALVSRYDIDENRVSSTGPVQASSESLTHAAIYELSDAINAVVHVHSRNLWDSLKDQLPTTAADVSYGTPEMAREFIRLYRDTSFSASGVAIMAGHDEGIISIGRDLEEAATRILALAHQGKSISN